MQENFFNRNYEGQIADNAPLAVRMRPRTLEEFVGQQHIIGKGKLLYRLISADKLSSVVFYGPPGTGKTSLAKIIANRTNAAFYELNAVTSGKKEITEVLDKAKDNLGVYNKKSILFIDELHRFNKAQQDALLPSVEKGLITLIGATTENPYFEINSPLLSRSTIFEFENLTTEDIRRVIIRAIDDRERGYGVMKIKCDEDALEHFAEVANGDVRRALNALELGILTVDKDAAGIIHIDLETAQECIQQRAVQYDKNGDNHYDTISAFIKSIRGSDPDAALYWMAKMITAGEDPKFIARRIVISASEDIGNAEPMALPVAMAAADAVQFIGMPEARINLAQAVVFLACAPKSNASYLAVDAAIAAVKHASNSNVPPHLQDTHYTGSKKMGRGLTYQYPHNYPEHFVAQQYLPDDLVGTHFYEPTEMGYEQKMKDYLKKNEIIKND
ncbi:replication-associated recombination protein A [Acetobacterium woodii]|uniref:Replication-associated recombination protein A n=1 Tax=Acetobacterium woodii (strain ATCC 29683 / DSM 1030 / JCM 2381 / KCTC 1655 / WB1) TaxID=931626 RepID=H6LFU2_ACEWD|nr:replication-associated recombination protein A [Acetobacterium woodii]AFA48230.1 recombination factor protein RarA [Acetobacterium woodii DSM 1030]